MAQLPPESPDAFFIRSGPPAPAAAARTKMAQRGHMVASKFGLWLVGWLVGWGWAMLSPI